jgi:hypothetical protein
LRVPAVSPALAGWKAGQQSEPFINCGYRVDREALRAASLDHVFAQHEVLHVRFGNEHTLGAREAARSADIEKAFDFLVHARNRLNLPVLIDGPGDRKVLPNGHVR